MLKSIHLHDFRSCHDVRLFDVGALNVLIGRNGAGKTNILMGIDWAARVLSSPSQIDDDPLLRSNGHVSIEFDVAGARLKYELKQVGSYEIVDGKPVIVSVFIEVLSRKDGNDWKTVLSRDGEKIELSETGRRIEISNRISAIRAVQALLPEGDSLRVLLDAITAFFGSIKYYPLKTDDGHERLFLTRADEYQQWVHGKKSLVDPVELLHYQILALYLTNKDRFEELCSLAGDDGLGILQTIEIVDLVLPQAVNDGSGERVTGEKMYFIRYSPSGHKEGAVFGYSDLSFGTRRILQFLVSLLYDSATVALVEQIEDGIHQGLLSKLISIVRSYAEDSQFVLTSHSEVVLDALDPTEIRVVELSDGNTQARQLSAPEIAAAKTYLEADGSFSEFLQSI